MSNQTTLQNPIKVEGVNVYNGRKNFVIFHPSDENSGISFIVNSSNGSKRSVEIPATLNFAMHKKKGIWLDNGKSSIGLVEHLLGAVYASGIDNVKIELSDGICPTTDNCAGDYFRKLNEQGLLIEQSSTRKFWKYAPNTATSIKGWDSKMPDCLTVSSSSNSNFEIDYFASYPHKVVGEQSYSFGLDKEIFLQDIADARPPGFLCSNLIKELFLFLGKNYAHGITEKNYLIITSKNSKKYANPEEFGVRYNGNEFVRHKISDVMGTLALTGRQFADTKFQFHMTGHKFDIYALKKLFDEGKFKDYIPEK